MQLNFTQLNTIKNMIYKESNPLFIHVTVVWLFVVMSLFWYMCLFISVTGLGIILAHLLLLLMHE